MFHHSSSGPKQQKWFWTLARWGRGLHLEASERLDVLCRGQQSVLGAAQRRMSATVADGTCKCGKIWPKAAKVGLDVGQMGEGAAPGGLREA